MRTKPLKLDLYILTEVTGPFLGGVLFFTFIFLMFQFLRLAEFFIIHGVSAITLSKMTLLMMLQFLPAALPVAFLIAVLVSFGRLSSDSELIAMKASGVSVPRLSIPVICVALVVVFVSLGLNMEWVPWGERLLQRIVIKVGNTKVTSSIKEGTFTSGFFDMLIYADKVDRRTNRLQGVFIYDEREPKNPLTVVAHEGEIVSVKTTNTLGAAAMLKLYNGNIHRSDEIANTYQKIDFNEYRLYLKIDEGEDNSSVKPRMIPYNDLSDEMKKPETSSGRLRELKTEYWRRYAVAFTPLLFVFLGIGYGTARTRAVRAGAALVAFVILVMYWAVQAAATIAVEKGYMPPFLAMQLPNFVILIIAARSFRSATW